MSRERNLNVRALLGLVVCTVGVCAAGAISAHPQQGEGAGNPPAVHQNTGPSRQEEKNNQEPDATAQGQDIRILSNLVETPVTVTDSKGEFVYDLGESDFHIFDNGVLQHIQTFSQETRPLAVVILIQTSDSLQPLLAQLQPLAPLFSGLLLGEQGRAALITFDSRVRVVQEFSGSGDQLAETFKNLHAQGNQARLNDALSRSIALLERRPKSERRIIVTFSDGFDVGSETSQEDVIQRATRAGATIYGLGFSRTQAMLKAKPKSSGPSILDQQVTRPVGPGVMPTPTNADNTYGTHGAGSDVAAAAGALIHSLVGSSPMEAYANYTGGVFQTHWTEKTLQEHFSRIASEIHAQYELAYVPASDQQPGFHQIEVRVMRPGVKVRARIGYIYTSSKR